MDLSLAMIAGRLEAFSPKLIGDQHETTIKYMRIFSPQAKPAVQTMDIGTADQFFKDGSEKIVCKYGNDYLIFDTENKEQMINEVLEVFTFYDRWNERLTQLIKAGCTLTELLDASQDVLENPLMILDSSDYIIAVSSQYVTVPVDELWFELLERKSSTPEKILAFHDPSNAIFDIRQRTPFYIPAGFFPRGTYSLNLYNGPVWCGLLICIEYLYPLSEAIIDDFRFLGTLIEQWIQQNTSADIFSVTQALFTEIFSGQAEKIPELSRRLLSLGFKSTDQKLLIKARALSKNFHTDAYLCRILNGSSRHIFASPCSGHILILCNISGTPREDLLRLIRQWFQKSRYCGGISFPFSALDGIQEHYQQASIALEYGEPLAGALCSIRDAALPYILHTLNTCIPAKMLHPAIELLADYDRRHHSSYGQTLRVFLENGQSQVKTAAKLNIHRNTLLQRLGRLQEDFGIHLEDPSERFYLLLSFYIAGGVP